MPGSEASARGATPGAVIVSPPAPRSSSRPSTPSTRTPRISQSSAVSARSYTRSVSPGARRQSPAAALQHAGSTAAAAAGRPASAAARALQAGTSATPPNGHEAGTAASTAQRQRVIRYILVVLRLALVGVGGVSLWPTVWTWNNLRASYAGRAAGAEIFIMVLLVAVCLNMLTEVVWIVLTLWPGLHEAAFRRGLSCGGQRFTIIIITEFVWSGFWLAMLLAMLLMKILWWLTMLTSILGITLSAAAVGLTVYLRVLTDREREAEEEVARVTVAVQVAQQSGKSAAAAGYKYLLQASAPRKGGTAPPAASLV